MNNNQEGSHIDKRITCHEKSHRIVMAFFSVGAEGFEPPTLPTEVGMLLTLLYKLCDFFSTLPCFYLSLSVIC